MTQLRTPESGSDNDLKQQVIKRLRAALAEGLQGPNMYNVFFADLYGLNLVQYEIEELGRTLGGIAINSINVEDFQQVRVFGTSQFAAERQHGNWIQDYAGLTVPSHVDHRELYIGDRIENPLANGYGPVLDYVLEHLSSQQ
jgi:hypothetical protein